MTIRTQRQRASSARYQERRAKHAAKDRDGRMCRWCGSGYLIEAAHIVDKQMGGDPTGARSDRPACYVTLCTTCHALVTNQRARIVVGPRGGDGPVEFRIRPPGGWGN